MPALTGQCKRCLRFGELYPARGIYYCRTCGDVFDRHLRGYDGPERRFARAEGESMHRRWADLPGPVTLGFPHPPRV